MFSSASTSQRSAAYRAVQPSFEDLGTPLPEVTFVVVDLETTGGAADDTITEIGAVKVRGGEVLGEFQTLVNPAVPIPALIAVLTGITNQMVATAPRLAAVLPSFLEFAAGSVLVAHNAGFDVGFLKRACAANDREWPGFPVVDTVALARQVLLRDEVPNVKLATLAHHFRAGTTPDHRALSDARATVDVLHGLLERVGNLGVATLEDLNDLTHRVSPQRRAKRVWADRVPEKPGIYWFHADLPDPDDPSRQRREVLYVGKSVNLRRRVRTYFTATEKRARMEEMVRVATGVETLVCATPLEAEVRELRMIAAHAPRYNRKSRRQDKVAWVKLTREAFPRLSITGKILDDGADYWGPFSGRQQAEQGVLALHDGFPIRQCTRKLSARTPSASCAQAELGRCPAPCELGEGAVEYSAVVARLRAALREDVRPVVATMGERLSRLARQHRFEEAGELTGRLQTYLNTTRRWHRMASLSRCAQIVAARHDGRGWQIHVIRHGRLAGAAFSPPGTNPRAVAEQTVQLASSVPVPADGMPAASIEEAERIAAWLESDGVRLIEIDGDWAWPMRIGLPAADVARLANVSLAPTLDVA
ncbi:DEDD exonuclease domain-containing protein [Tessaracoccus sp. SD287]|uniref:DEDD exonuclease domain-containing protein n=1 Tax=Tessaracoccus sp. SD287 TaxID=2782008 RepID=UPI001A97ADCD|nr:DEDD exonuclease domain-containing protein [Tessaracoccus sp. SD287]MBO1032403.1 DEDD exonuclease domain-containing protein [Tessaracoccus sp. SD287]